MGSLNRTLTPSAGFFGSGSRGSINPKSNYSEKQNQHYNLALKLFSHNRSEFIPSPLHFNHFHTFISLNCTLYVIYSLITLLYSTRLDDRILLLTVRCKNTVLVGLIYSHLILGRIVGQIYMGPTDGEEIIHVRHQEHFPALLQLQLVLLTTN